MTWTDQRIADLRQLYADGLSSSQIANELGGGLTRNAIIGKVTRLGLTRLTHPSSANRPPHLRHRKPPPSTKRISPTKSTHHTRVAAWRMAPVVEQPPVPDVTDSAMPIGKRCTIFELTEETCRWPTGHPGEPDFFFCGAKRLEGRPYCSYHCRVAYQPSSAARPFIPMRNDRV